MTRPTFADIALPCRAIVRALTPFLGLPMQTLGRGFTAPARGTWVREGLRVLRDEPIAFGGALTVGTLVESVYSYELELFGDPEVGMGTLDQLAAAALAAFAPGRTIATGHVTRASRDGFAVVDRWLTDAVRVELTVQAHVPITD